MQYKCSKIILQCPVMLTIFETQVPRYWETLSVADGTNSRKDTVMHGHIWNARLISSSTGKSTQLPVKRTQERTKQNSSSTSKFEMGIVLQYIWLFPSLLLLTTLGINGKCSQLVQYRWINTDAVFSFSLSKIVWFCFDSVSNILIAAAWCLVLGNW